MIQREREKEGGRGRWAVIEIWKERKREEGDIVKERKDEQTNKQKCKKKSDEVNE